MAVTGVTMAEGLPAVIHVRGGEVRLATPWPTRVRVGMKVGVRFGAEIRVYDAERSKYGLRWLI